MHCLDKCHFLLSFVIKIFCFLNYDPFVLVFSNISSNSVVGVAHQVSFMRPYGRFDVAAVTLANSLSLFPYVDSIYEKLDFIGMNYYGQVFI